MPGAEAFRILELGDIYLKLVIDSVRFSLKIAVKSSKHVGNNDK